uniref:Uncharacterized protein n=1 Tax=Ditylenchus dipsaci TaxID=166011 RepID=A0A915DD47_9BILA
MSLVALWVILGVVLIVIILLAVGLLCYCHFWKWKQTKKPAVDNTTRTLPDAQQTRQTVTSISSARSKENQQGAEKKSGKVDLEKVVVVSPSVKPVPVDHVEVKATGDASKKDRLVEHSSKAKPNNELVSKSKPNQQTVIGDLGGVSVIKEDPSMRTLIKDVREVPMPRMSRKDWLRATNEVFEQQEHQEREEANRKPSPKNQIVHPVSIDWAQSIVYVMPNNEFTQETETTQSSQMQTSASMHEPVFPSGVLGSETMAQPNK